VGLVWHDAAMLRVAELLILLVCDAVANWRTAEAAAGQGRTESPILGASADHRVPTYNFVLAGLLGRLGEPRQIATNTFVSFNYDLLVDETLSKLEVPC
jgi:hypothetical protein